MKKILFTLLLLVLLIPATDTAAFFLMRRGSATSVTYFVTQNGTTFYNPAYPGSNNAQPGTGLFAVNTAASASALNAITTRSIYGGL